VAITLICECGRRLDFKDEYAGRQVRCPDCDKVNTVGNAEALAAMAAAAEQGDQTWAREKFLLKQKALAIQEKYDVADENGNSLLFIQRPRYIFRGFVALFAAIAGAGALFLGASWLVQLLVPDIEIAPWGPYILTGIWVPPFLAFFVIAIAMSPKRHVSFFRDASMRERVLEIKQDSKWQPIVATFTVCDEKGKVIAHLRKNYLFNLFRKRWVCVSPSGATLLMAKEDSIILSLLRRLLGTFFGLLRAQFILTRGETDVIIGEFNRKFTLLDRYVLDMTRDARRVIDRRLALAMGVMLDSGERR
jgi:uncharacterized protein YxjI